MNTLLALIFSTVIYTAPAMDPIDQGTTCYWIGDVMYCN